MKPGSILILLLSTYATAADWPQWRGPQHNGISTEKDWRAEWSGGGPKVIWKAQVGIGFGSFAVADGRVFTTGHRDGKDTVFCFDAATGREVWKHSYAAELGDKFYEGGTSATPTVDGARTYHLSRWGDAFCFNSESGKRVWEKNVAKETGAAIPDWGFAGSPLVMGDLLVLNVGKTGCAVQKATGAVAWKSGTEKAGYSTPMPWRRGGELLTLIGSGGAYFAVDGKTGAVAWEFPWTTRYGVNATEPIGSGDHLFISTGYNKGCVLLKVDSNAPAVVWQSKELRNQFSGSILLNGCVYGIDNDQNTRASLKCIDLMTGALKWKDDGVGFGSLMAADGKLIVLTSKGELITAKASPEKFDVISRAQVLDGRCWTQPVLANGRIYCRNAGGDVVCLDVRAK